MLKGKLAQVMPVEAKDLPEIESWRRQRSDKSPYLGLALTHPVLTADDLFKRTASKSFLVRSFAGELAGIIVTDNEKYEDRNIAVYLDKTGTLGDDCIFEGLLLMLNQLFNEKNFFRVYTHVADYDTETEELFVAAGFKKEALLRQHLFCSGVYRDVFVYGLLKDESKT